MRFILLLILLFGRDASACDICNMYAGIMPEDYRNTAGVYHRFRTLGGVVEQGVVKPGGVSRHASHIPVDLTSFNLERYEVQETFAVTEARLRLQFGQRFSVMAIVPLMSNTRRIDGVVITRSVGVGDPTLMAGYQLVNTYVADTAQIKVQHRFGIYGGIRFPGGAMANTWQGKLVDFDMQPGKGAFDAILMAEYLFRVKRTGLSSTFSSRIGLATLTRYAYGNAHNATMALFHQIPLSLNVSLYPRVGTVAEMADKDRFDDEIEEGTGGYLVMAEYGCDFYYRSFSVGFSYQQGVINKWNETQLPVRNRIQAQLQYIF